MPKVKFWEAGAVQDQITNDNRWAEIRWDRGHATVQVGVGCGEGYGTDMETKSQYMTLDDRSAVNRMIRELRNARDAAFGKDA